MNVVIRTDASTALGSGHVMRCLTLAEELRRRGATVAFVCRIREGHMGDSVEARGFVVFRLDVSEFEIPASGSDSDAVDAAWQQDAVQTQALIQATGTAPDWLVVDHYALDRRWETLLRSAFRRIMVIDDLADRPHDCDLLLDQNFASPLHARYAGILPPNARSLLGTDYALVRAEFAQHRPCSLARRDGRLRRVLISMGGTDPRNDTAAALAGLAAQAGDGIAVDVVIGAGNPHRQTIRRMCSDIPKAELHILTSCMGELMTRADLAVTAGGSTTWERCVLGVPAIVAIQSAHQAPIAEAVERAGGQRVLGWAKDLTAQDYGRALQTLTADELIRMSAVSATLCDGRGAERVVTHMSDWNP